VIAKRITSAVIILCLLNSQASAYGHRGHTLVGAIADQLLARESVETKISSLLDGVTLAEAAVLPDEIKAWDKKPPTEPGAWHLAGHPAIETQLIAFWKANPPTSHNPASLPPNHHWFHYADVPVMGGLTYAGGHTGRSKWDVVNMIPFCVDVLRGKIAEDNDRKITKPVAVILLAHYLGDIHQPLHVGAEYFDENGQPVDPDTDSNSFADEGGNSLTLILNQTSDHGHSHSSYKLHGFWDEQAVDNAMELTAAEIRDQRGGAAGEISDDNIARWFAAHEPTNWKLPASLDAAKWSAAWADEILPIAREAHERLVFAHINLIPTTKTAHGQAIEKRRADGKLYQVWAGSVVHDEIHKAGWRLAELLKQSVN
jgi:hypothetical protein